METHSRQTAVSPLTRREFLKVTTLTGAGLVLAVYLPGCSRRPTATTERVATPELIATSEPTVAATAPPAATATIKAALPTPATAATVTAAPPTPSPAPADVLAPNLFVRVDPQGGVTITVARSEMGQGVRTALAMIVAEELDADWSAVRVEQAPGDRAYGDQTTGGSVSVSDHFDALRRAGATARHMLVAAAAQEWAVLPESCRTDQGWVIHSDGERRLSYGELARAASALPVPASSEVKDSQDFRLIGQPLGHWDAPEIITGRAVYGSDVRLPGMLYATVARCPVFGGRVASLDAAPARAVPGVRDVAQIDEGVAVVAESTWAALQGREALAITWDEGQGADQSSESIREALVKGAAPLGGDATNDPSRMSAAYDIPFLAHATMEPMTCTADVRAERCEVWAPSQDPQRAKQAAMRLTELPVEAVTVHVPLLGGGFGRRHETDFVAEAVRLSQAVGAPMQVMWTREDDLQHDFYHPLSYNTVEGKLNQDKRMVWPPLILSFPSTSGVPTGYWRSVGNFTDAFVRECFLDEVAAATGRDPLELRLDLLSGRGRAVVELAANKAGWGTPLPAGWGRGLAYYATFGVTHVAHVVEVSVAPNGAIRVERVICAVDCGMVINPDTVVAQMEGGIAFGLTAALKAHITIENGRVAQSNFHDYPLLRIDEMPQVEVHIVPSTERPTGIGEMGVPPIAPAVANAIFAATGKRVRHLRIRAQDLV